MNRLKTCSISNNRNKQEHNLNIQMYSFQELLNLFNLTYKISIEDFKGWKQERGIYFVSDCDSNYTSLISMHDPGEKDANGSIIAANYGKGHFIYTGLVFFRELPAGIPGAYRLFANMMEY